MWYFMRLELVKQENIISIIKNSEFEIKKSSIVAKISDINIIIDLITHGYMYFKNTYEIIDLPRYIFAYVKFGRRGNCTKLYLF